MARCGLRVQDVATLIGKPGNFVTKWLNKGLRMETSFPDFKRRIDDLDAAISRMS